MINIELSSRDIGQPGLYIMRHKGKTGLIRMVGSAKVGYKLINLPDGAETYMKEIPADGLVPSDALLSEPLAIVKV